MQRKPLTAEVLNFTKRLGEKVLTIYHRKSLFQDKSSNTILDFLDKFFLSNDEPYVDVKYIRTNIVFIVVADRLFHKKKMILAANKISVSVWVFS